MSHSKEAEQAVIGCLLSYGLEAAELIQKINPDMFNDVYLKIVFIEIRKMANNGELIDVISVGNIVNTNDMAFLISIQENACDIPRAFDYLAILKKHSLSRKLKGVALGIEEMCNNGEAEEALLYAQNKLIEFTQDSKQEQETIKPALKRVINQMQVDFESATMSGIPTGISDIDNTMDGLQKQTMSVLSGVPGSGKTTLAMGIAMKASEKAPVLVFSMEMSKDQLLKRMLSTLSNIPMDRVMSSRKMKSEDWPKLTMGANKAIRYDETIIIDDSPMVSPSYIRMKANEIKLRYGGLGLVVIDYFKMLETPKGEKTLEATTNNAAAINRLKKELDVPILLLAQLNKDVMKTGKRPVQGDLDWGQQLIKDADNIMFLYKNDQLDDDKVINFYSDKTRNSEAFNTHLKNELGFNRLTSLDFTYKESEEKGQFVYK